MDHMKRSQLIQLMHWMPVFALVLSALLPASAWAQHAGDIILTTPANRITTGTIESGGGEITPQRIFTGTLVSGINGPFTSDPGFDTLPGTFQDDAFVGFNVLAPVLGWTGSDFQSTEGERLRINFFPPFGPTVDTADGPVPGFELAVGSNGEWHRHLGYTLIRDDMDPQPGIYLLQLELYTTQPGIDASDPFWILFQFNATGDIEAAIAFVASQYLAPPCPWDIHPAGNTQTGDGAVNVDDFFALLQHWGACPADAPCPWDCAPFEPGDSVWGDDAVDVGDFFALLQHWGACP
jgi:hypothetical protein